MKDDEEMDELSEEELDELARENLEQVADFIEMKGLAPIFADFCRNIAQGIEPGAQYIEVREVVWLKNGEYWTRHYSFSDDIDEARDQIITFAAFFDEWDNDGGETKTMWTKHIEGIEGSTGRAMFEVCINKDNIDGHGNYRRSPFLRAVFQCDESGTVIFCHTDIIDDPTPIYRK